MKVEPARATGDHGAGPQGRGVMSTLDTPRRSERSARSGTGAPSRVRAGFRVPAARGHRQRALRLAAARARGGERRTCAKDLKVDQPRPVDESGHLALVNAGIVRKEVGEERGH